MSTFGPLLGIVTLFVIGLGFPLVIHGERRFGYWCWPYMLGIGLLLIIASLFIPNDWASALVGVLGATFAWGSTELKEQAVRARLGWFPHNPNKTHLPFTEIFKKWKAPHL